LCRSSKAQVAAARPGVFVVKTLARAFQTSVPLFTYEKTVRRPGRLLKKTRLSPLDRHVAVIIGELGLDCPVVEEGGSLSLLT
jgi:hypothetical protein